MGHAALVEKSGTAGCVTRKSGTLIKMAKNPDVTKVRMRGGDGEMHQLHATRFRQAFKDRAEGRRPVRPTTCASRRPPETFRRRRASRRARRRRSSSATVTRSEQRRFPGLKELERNYSVLGNLLDEAKAHDVFGGAHPKSESADAGLQLDVASTVLRNTSITTAIRLKMSPSYEAIQKGDI